MSTRSNYLARALLSRARSLAESLDEDGVQAAQARERMRELVAKVLVVEEGITEEAKIRFVVDAMPAINRGRATLDREMRELAESLEAGLWR